MAKDLQQIQMVQRCIEEIQQLRAERDNLAPFARAFLVLEKVVNKFDDGRQGYGEDLVWRLKKHLEELQTEKNEVEPE